MQFPENWYQNADIFPVVYSLHDSACLAILLLNVYLVYTNVQLSNYFQPGLYSERNVA